MKLLYVPCGHPLQEADDCQMWQKLGLDWFSTGYYSQSQKPGDLPYINHSNDPALMSLWQQCEGEFNIHDIEGGPLGRKNKTFTSYNLPNIWTFTKEFLSHFDVIFFNHHIQNLRNNWGTISRLHKDVRVVVKTFAMHPIEDEIWLKKYRDHPMGLVYSVRNSPTESKQFPADKYAGHDAIIHGSVVMDEDSLPKWIGDKQEVVTFSNNFHCADKRRNTYIRCKDLSEYPFRLFGAGNDKELLSEGFVSHKQKMEIMRHARVSLTTGTPGSTNTYSFVEAWMMGLPQVVYGPYLWRSPCYEPNILGKHGQDILIGNTLEELNYCINLVMQDNELAKRLSEQSKEKARKVYGRDVLAKQWETFFANTIWQSRSHHQPNTQKSSKNVHVIRK